MKVVELMEEVEEMMEEGGGGAKGQGGEVSVEVFAISGEINLTSSLDLKR